jgi:hypothetical protein
MRTSVLIVGCVMAMLNASAAFPQEPQSPPLSLKHQMAACMNKSMSANRTLSYNDAQKDCKDRVLTSGQTGIGKRALAANAADAPALKNP